MRTPGIKPCIKRRIEMRNLEENIVPSTMQNSKNYYPNEGSGLRIMFAGNSVTKHAPKPEIGWERDCGMAASCLENDYVHLTVEKIREYDKNVAFAIAQVADYERGYMNGALESYSCAAGFRPDILVMFFGANVPKEYNEDTEGFAKAYEDFRNLVSIENTKVYTIEGFYNKPFLDAGKRKVCEKYGDTFIELGETRTRPETHGMFNHPNDLGMREIAEKLFEAIKPEVIRLAKER